MSQSTDEANEKRSSGGIETMTLRRAVALFCSHASPLVLIAGVAVAWPLRVYLGGWTVWDLVIFAGLMAAWPLVEWVIHVGVLHFKPFELLGRRVDFHLARKHRAHHREPDELEHVFIPFRSLLLFLPVALIGWWAVVPTVELMVTGVAGLFTMGLVYEWTHFLIHTNYRAKTSLFKRLWRHHRLHHFKHEQNWFGVSTTMGDRLLGTAPDFQEIETSDTCRTLGVEESCEDDNADA